MGNAVCYSELMTNIYVVAAYSFGIITGLCAPRLICRLILNRT
jgi:hypothetical protein